MHHGSRRTDFRALYRANAVLDRIISYWSPLIEEAHANGDPLAYSFLCVFAPFVRVVLNSDVLRTWLIRRQAEAKGGPIDKENARHSLTSEEAHCLGFAVQAAEEMLYYLSTASRTSTAQRNHVWAKRDPSTGHRPPLQLDPDVAQRMSSAVDSVLLVIYAFPPLFLAQMRAQVGPLAGIAVAKVSSMENAGADHTSLFSNDVAHVLSRTFSTVILTWRRR